ncbi:hypothetical protein [Ancylobacter lacus]|uniref:hypothetical protein n=1 Tax=Ancylobacter lacus TaxID=2579970 RepID=UPI001BCB3555|nr:hypothetical protein [Ancylobacter lacus]MBS7539061.1 hypothetical protein [Ancylobacter lacus]
MTEQTRSDILIVAVAGCRAGLAARLDSGFRFHASNHRFNGLDGQEFATVEDIHAAARGALAKLRRSFPLSAS